MSNSTAAPVSVTKDTVGGIPIQLYGIDQLPQDTSRNGLTVLFFLHGRFGSAQEPKMVRWCTKLIESSREHRQAAGGQGGPAAAVIGLPTGAFELIVSMGCDRSSPCGRHV